MKINEYDNKKLQEDLFVKIYLNFKTHVNVIRNFCFGKFCFINHLLTKKMSLF